MVFDEAWTELKVVVKGLVMRQVLSSDTTDDNFFVTEKKTTEIIWKADLDSLSRVSGLLPPCVATITYV